MCKENEKAVKGNRVILCEADQFDVNQTVICSTDKDGNDDGQND